jgi:hypothetical protein
MLTRSRKKALSKFLHKRHVTPQVEGIRTDVARALFDGGYVTVWTPGDTFRHGYAPLTITSKGQEAAVAPLSAGKSQ